ncbi:MAG: alpha/beta hydrolase [Chryseobacterium sp.]|nr:MAG: alpha/beta hydrolase [Chryseobacterium sp.]
MKTPIEKLPTGTMTEFIIEAPQLGRSKTIWVYLPNGYEESQTAYPVVYMHDGQNVFDHAESEKREWHAAEKLDEINAQAIVIGIEHGGANRRIDEMTPYKNEKYGGGHADDYLDFIVNTLKPHIDKEYRTLAEKENTIIFGASVGGLISFYALLKFPEIFGSAGVFSPSFWFSDEIFALMDTIDHIDGRIYFMSGDHESMGMVPDIEHMEKLIFERVSDKNQIFKKIVHNGRHSEKLWAKEFTEAYQWLVKK